MLMALLAVLGTHLATDTAAATLPQGTVICLDPGHASEVGTGASGKRISELAAVWQVALEVERMLKRAGATVVRTKGRMGQFVSNRDRASAANQAQADLMVRLHMDAAPVRGFATYYPADAGQVNGMVGPSAEVRERSKAAATAFHQAAAVRLKGVLPMRGLYTDKHTKVGGQQGALTGSIYSKVPVLLVELCTITLPEDEAIAASPQGRKKLAEGVFAGIVAAIHKLDDPAP